MIIKDFNNIMNALDVGNSFCINGTIISTNNIVYKVKGWSDILNNTVMVEGLLLQDGGYVIAYHAEFELYDISLIDNLKKSIKQARDNLSNVIANYAFLDGTLNEYNDGEPKDLLEGLIDEKILIENSPTTQSLQNDINAQQEKSFLIKMHEEQHVLDNMINYIVNEYKECIQFRGTTELVRSTIIYSTIVADEEFKAYNVLDTAIAFEKVLFAGMISHYGDNQILLGDGNVSMQYISNDINDLRDIVLENVYSTVNFIQKITSEDIHVKLFVKRREK